MRDLSRDDDIGEYPVGYRVGPYQFVSRIGRGGMGAVWLATRFDREYRKQVAIKMVKRGMDSQEILRRFRTERQVLANLDHPNIARLIDGGSTPDGLPYLVMEYVEGMPIDQYCEQRRCSISERLNLFRDGLLRRALRAPKSGRPPRYQDQQHPGRRRRS